MIILLMSMKVKKIAETYKYEELGFPIVLKNIVIIDNREYEYPLINHEIVKQQAAINLIVKHENIDGARLKFLRNFLNFSLDDMKNLTGISKSTLHIWEKESGKPLDIPSEKLKLIFLKVRDQIARNVLDQLDRAIIKDVVVTKKVMPLEILS